jgi:hypothetical protein
LRRLRHSVCHARHAAGDGAGNPPAPGPSDEALVELLIFFTCKAATQSLLCIFECLLTAQCETGISCRKSGLYAPWQH